MPLAAQQSQQPPAAFVQMGPVAQPSFAATIQAAQQGRRPPIAVVQMTATGTALATLLP